MRNTWEQHSVTLQKGDKEIEIVVAFDNTIPLDSCLIQKKQGVFNVIKRITLCNLIKNYIEEGYILFDWDDIIPSKYKE